MRRTKKTPRRKKKSLWTRGGNNSSRSRGAGKKKAQWDPCDPTPHGSRALSLHRSPGSGGRDAAAGSGPAPPRPRRALHLWYVFSSRFSTPAPPPALLAEAFVVLFSDSSCNAAMPSRIPSLAGGPALGSPGESGGRGVRGKSPHGRAEKGVFPFASWSCCPGASESSSGGRGRDRQFSCLLSTSLLFENQIRLS
jgi:hypothetical protein